MIKILQFPLTKKQQGLLSLLPAISNYALGKYLLSKAFLHFLLLLVVLCLCLPHLVISAPVLPSAARGCRFRRCRPFSKTAMVLQKRQLLIRWGDIDRGLIGHQRIKSGVDFISLIGSSAEVGSSRMTNGASFVQCGAMAIFCALLRRKSLPRSLRFDIKRS